jgi:hypothetical protein
MLGAPDTTNMSLASILLLEASTSIPQGRRTGKMGLVTYFVLIMRRISSRRAFLMPAKCATRSDPKYYLWQADMRRSNQIATSLEQCRGLPKDVGGLLTTTSRVLSISNRQQETVQQLASTARTQNCPFTSAEEFVWIVLWRNQTFLCHSCSGSWD